MTENFQSSNEELKKYCEELKKDVQLNKNVLFIHCPLFSIDTFERSVAKNRGYYSCNPVGLQYLSSSLKGRGLNIEIFDLNYEILKKSNSDDSFNPFDWLDIVDEHIGGKDYSVIGFSNLYIANIPYFVKIKKYLEERGKHIIITGGPNATYNTKEFLKKGLCHFVCERESENKINFLFDNLYENKGCKPTPGILFKPNEEIIETSGEKDIVELEGNLIDSYDLIPIEDYCKTGSTSPYSRMVGKDVPFALILFNRGCRGNCSFCDVRDFTGGYNRTRKIEDFLDEMEYLNKKRGIKFFEIIDDDFTMNKEKTLEVLRGIQERKLDIKWAANTGMIGSSLGEELMKEIKDSGCVGFHIGVESGNSDSLKKIGKLGTRESFLEFSKIAQKYPEMFIMENYILGFPHEDFGKMKESFDFSFELNLDWGHFNLYQEYTKKEEALKENDKVTDFVPTKDFF